MKILLIHQFFLEDDHSGGSRFNEMTRIWTEMGHQVTVLAGMIHANEFKKNREYKWKWTVRKKQALVDIVRCHVSESYNRSFLGRAWGYVSFIISSTWAGLFKTRGKFDIILVSSPPLFVGITAYILSVLKKCPFVFEVRDLWPESAVETGVLSNIFLIRTAKGMERFLYKKAKIINVLTPAFRKILVEEKNVPADKIIMIPNGSDFRLLEAALVDFNREEFRDENNLSGRFVLVYVGAHGLANHLIQIIRAAELLKEEGVLFLLIGSGMQKELLIREAEKRSLNNIRFIERIPKSEVFKYIKASDMGISVLKKAEVFKTIYSNKTFDYMACKKPVLMLIDGISKELVENVGCGVYAEPENPSDIAEKIRNCINERFLLQEQGERGYDHARKNFDREVLSRSYLDELFNIIK